jgi:hypothetical protein
MAKALLNTGKVQCEDLTNVAASSEDAANTQAALCTMQVILREIISEQNHQIQTMRGILDAKSFPQENDCKVLHNQQSERKLARANRKKERQSKKVAQKEPVARREQEEGICQAACETDEASGEEVCHFTAKLDLYASELGYYQFEECGDAVNPTLGIEVGKTYRFIQKDPSNHYHPLGFAYYPDGAHDGKDELESGIPPPGSSSTCDVNLSCPGKPTNCWQVNTMVVKSHLFLLGF